MKTSFLLVTALFGITSFAVERPTLPAPGEDKVLTDGKTAREFFAERTKDSACRRDLLELRKKYKTEHATLKKLKADGASESALDDQGEATVRARRAAVLKNNECGECAARPTEQRVIQTPARTEVWYISDGSCQLPYTDAAKLAETYSTLRDSLVRIKQFPHYGDGLHHILELKSVDPKTAKLVHDKDLLDPKPELLFISVRGPEIFGLLTAFSYLFEAKVEDKGAEGNREFMMTGVGQRPPLGFQFPEVYSHNGSGSKVAVPPGRQKKVSSVLALWYLNEEGYLRYFTAADFGVSLKFVEELGQEVMLDSVFAQYHRVAD